MSNINFFEKKREDQARNKFFADGYAQKREMQAKIREEQMRVREERKRKSEVRSINQLSKETGYSKPGYYKENQSSRVSKYKPKTAEATKDTQRQKVSQFSGFTQGLRNDINKEIDTKKALKMKEKEITSGLVPGFDPDVAKKLDKIAEKIRPGKENVFYNIKEGWHEREVQNLLSQEYVKKMNGKANAVDQVEKWLEEHPEIGRSGIEDEDEGILKKFVNSGVRFVGSGTRLQYESMIEASKDPNSWAWAGTILAASIMAAPFTGGASLTLNAASPVLIANMPLLTKTFASLKPITAITLGMKAGTMNNMANIEAGSAYKDYLDAGIDERIARKIAPTVGAFNGIIEYLQIDNALSAIPGLSNLVENGTKMAQKEMIKEITKVMTNYGVDLTSNVIEEMAQAGVTEMGLGLGHYLKDAPDPTTTGGLKALAKTMTTDDFRDTLLEEGLGALQSMWLSPILASGGKMAVNKGVGKAASSAMADKVQKQKFDFLTQKEGITDLLIKDVNETLDLRSVEVLGAERTVLKDMQENAKLTNKDKLIANETIEKIDKVITKVMYDTKAENPSVEFRKTNNTELLEEVISPTFEDQNEIQTDDFNSYEVEKFKEAQKLGVVDDIRIGLREGKLKGQIQSKIANKIPRKGRNRVDIFSLINSVEIVDKEVKAQATVNEFHNLQAVRKQQFEKMQEEVIDDNTIKEEVKTDEALQEDLNEEEVVDDVNVQEEVESPTEEVLDSPDAIQEDELVSESEVEDLSKKDEQLTEKKVEQEDLTQEKPQASETFKPSEIKRVDVNKINTDAERFQFRFNKGSKDGATDKLVGAEYNPDLAGVILAWEDENNDIYVVNGHHRLDLAKNSGVEQMDARIISHTEYTADEARALGAMVNIAENNATSIDVAKLIRDTGITQDDFKEYGITPKSKIAKDGLALSNLNDWIFTQAATRGIAIERAILIGRELAGNEDGQNQIIRAIGQLESKGKTITNDVLAELLAEVKGTAQEEFVETTLFGEETMTKNYSVERAELVAYTKSQLKDRKNLLKNVSKSKNAALLNELGNSIAIDDNVKEMNTADQALFILDKTLNYKGTKVNELFNKLAKEYAGTEPMNRNKIKKKGLQELVSLMEGGQLLDTVSQEVEREGIKDLYGINQGDGEGEQGPSFFNGEEKQVDLFGQDTMLQMKEQEETRILADKESENTTAYKATKRIAESIKKNPVFNGLTIDYTNKSGKVNFTQEELIENGYGHLTEGEKYIYGQYNNGERKITLNLEATRDTILEEAIHDIQHRLDTIDPDLAESVRAWEDGVRERASEEGITIPDGYELLAQALVYTEYGYASTNEFIANLIAVDDEIVEKFTTLLGEDIADSAFGMVESKVEKSERPLNANKVMAEMRAKIQAQDIATYKDDANGNYAMVHKEGEAYQVSYFNEDIGPVGDIDFDTIEEATKKLTDDGIYQVKDSGSYWHDINQSRMLKPDGSSSREVADEMYERYYTSENKTNMEFTGKDIRKVRDAIKNGNFNQADYDKLIKDNKNITNHAKKVLSDLVEVTKKQGIDKPNSEVTFKEFLNRFYGIEVDNSGVITEDEIGENFIYYLDSIKDRDSLNEKAKEQVTKEWNLSEEDIEGNRYDAFFDGQANVMAKETIGEGLKKKYEQFKEGKDIDPYKGVTYQLKDENEVFYTNDVEVIKNPTNTQYQQVANEFYKEFPHLRDSGEIAIRTTYDKQGNKYIWNANEGTHSTIESGINKKYNTETNQNMLFDYQIKDEQKAPTFYSKLQTVIDQKMQNNANPDEVMNMIKKAGVRQDEIDWSGIEEFLSVEDKVNKEDLKDFLLFNSLQIVEDELSGDDTMYSQYTLEGGRNYKELLFVMGEDDSVWNSFNRDKQAPYKGSHYNTDNILAHTRYNDRTDAEGNKILFIEEVQSDWHQEGRDKGYNKRLSMIGKDRLRELNIERDSLIEKLSDEYGYFDVESLTEEQYEKYEKLSLEIYELKMDSLRVPDAPLKTTWHEFVLKRMIREAAEKGYDKLAWTTGEQQNERYKLSKSVDHINWSYGGNEEVGTLYAYNGGELIVQKHLEAKDLPSHIGKELSEKLLAQESRGANQFGIDQKSLEGEDLDIGGEGMKGFYNQMIPRFLKKYVKKWGSDVEVIDMESESNAKANEDGELDAPITRQLAIPITDKMRAEVLGEGQPLFQIKDDTTEGNLIVTHTVPESKLRNILKLGGMPVPSMAITKKDQPLERFGDINLIFNKDTIDPKKKANEVFASDVYSKRFPRVEYEIDGGALQRLSNRIGVYIDESELEGTDIVTASEDLMRKQELQEYYLKKEGIEIEMPQKGRKYSYPFNNDDPAIKQFIIDNDLTFLKMMDDETLKDQYNNLVEKHYEDKYKDTEKPTLRKNISKTLIDLLNKEIEMQQKTGYYESDRTVKEYNQDFEAIKNGNVMVDDLVAYGEILDLKVEENKEQFQEYLLEELEPLYGEKGIRNNKDLFTPADNRRSWKTLHDPYNLQSVLKHMKGDTRGSEGFNYGLGSVRAGVSKQFTSIQDIKSNEHLLVDNETFNEIKTEFNTQYSDLETKLNKHHPVKYGRGFDDAMMNISSLKSLNEKNIKSELAESGFDVTEMPSELIEEVTTFIDKLKTMETEYFEAKPQRIVELSEIQAAVVPNTISQEVEQMLIDNNVILEKYEGAENRQKAIDTLLGKKDLTFQIKDNLNHADTMDQYYELSQKDLSKKEKQEKERSWGQTVRDADITSEELKQVLTDNKFMYQPKNNQDTLIAAAKWIEEKGQDYAEATILSDLPGNDLMFTAAQILTIQHMDSGNTDRAMVLNDAIAKKATGLGQAIQSLSIFGRQTPEGMLRYVSSRFNKLMTGADKERLNINSDIITKKFNEINSRALKQIDFTDSINKLKVMGKDEMVVRELNKSEKGQALIDKYGLESILRAIEGTEEVDTTIIDQVDAEDLKPFTIDQTELDDSMTSQIQVAISDYHKIGGNLKQTLMDLGLNELESKLLETYSKQELKDATLGEKEQVIKKNLSTRKQERASLNDKIIDASLDGDIDKQSIMHLLAEKEGMPVLDDELVEYIYNQGKFIDSLEEGTRERDVATAELMAEIANKLPTSLWEKIGTIQTMAHLLNVRTTLRNLIGNELFGKIDTLTMNYIAPVIDKGYSALSGERTSIHRNLFKLFKTQYKGYGEGFKLGYDDAIRGIDTTENADKYGLRKQKTFTKGPLGAMETALNVTMRATDRAAQQAAFVDSLQEQMEIAGVDAPTEEMMENATALGLYRTFNDTTALSKGFSTVKKALNTISSAVTGQDEFGLGDLVLKYPSTPANILSRAIDYSPVGLVNTMIALKQETEGNTYLRQKIVVDGISRAIGGTSLIGLGFVLAKMGVLRGEDPEEDKKIYQMKKDAGLRNYGVNTTALNRYILSGFSDPTAGDLRIGDKIVAYDWVEPMAIPLAVGADTASGGDAASTIDTIIKATSTGMRALTDQPLLSGLSRMFGYGDIVGGLQGVGLDTPSSFTPSLMGHIANFVDGTAKDPYTNYTGLREAYNKVINKVPGAKGTLPSRYSNLGEELRYYPEDVGLISRTLHSIVSPAFYGNYNPTPEAQIVLDVYEQTGNKDAVPKSPQKSYTIDGTKYELTPREYEEMAEWMGKEATARIKYAESNLMKGWDAEAKSNELKFIVSEIGKEARERVKQMKVGSTPTNQENTNNTSEEDFWD